MTYWAGDFDVDGNVGGAIECTDMKGKLCWLLIELDDELLHQFP